MLFNTASYSTRPFLCMGGYICTCNAFVPITARPYSTTSPQRLFLFFWSDTKKTFIALSLSLSLHIPPTISRLHNHTNTPRLRNNTLHHRLQTHARQPRLTLLNLRNLINMLQTDFPHTPQRRISRRSRCSMKSCFPCCSGCCCGCFDFGPSGISCAAKFVFDG